MKGMLTSFQVQASNHPPDPSSSQIPFTGFSPSGYKIDDNGDEYRDQPQNSPNLMKSPHLLSSSNPRLSSINMSVQVPSIEALTSSISQKMESDRDDKLMNLDGEDGQNNGDNTIRNEQKAKKVRDEAIGELRGYVELMDKFSLHNFVIWKGKAMTTTPEFKSFQRKYEQTWGPISQIIGKIEKMMWEYDITLAICDGQVIADLADCDNPNLSEDDLLTCISNTDQIKPKLQVKTIGSNIPNRELLAAIRIQSAIRKSQAVNDFKRRRGRERGATAIQSLWRMFVARVDVCERLGEIRGRMEEEVEGMREELADSWDQLQNTPHVEIHLPSLSFPEYVRLGFKDFRAMLNAHLSSLHRFHSFNNASHASHSHHPQEEEGGGGNDHDKDGEDVEEEDEVLLLEEREQRMRNKTILFISPIHLPPDVIDYHKRLLLLSGVPPDVITHNLRFLVPEAATLFSPHFSPASLLLYSPQLLSRIARLVGSKPSFILSGPAGWAEKRVSFLLHSPLLSPPPSLCSSLSIISNGKQVFHTSDVSVPIGSHHIYTERDLLVSLCKLIVGNLRVDRWIIRLETDVNGESTMLLEVGALPAVRELRLEQNAILKSGEESAVDDWFSGEMQLLSRSRVLKDLKISISALKIQHGGGSKGGGGGTGESPLHPPRSKVKETDPPPSPLGFNKTIRSSSSSSPHSPSSPSSSSAASRVSALLILRMDLYPTWEVRIIHITNSSSIHLFVCVLFQSFEGFMGEVGCVVEAIPQQLLG